MRASLAVMSQLPVFGERSAKLTELQTRLEAMATPHLLEALESSSASSSSDAERAQKLVSLTALFRSIDRTSAVQSHYYRSRCDHVARIVTKCVTAAVAAAPPPPKPTKPVAPAASAPAKSTTGTGAAAGGKTSEKDAKSEPPVPDANAIASETLPQWLPQLFTELVEYIRGEAEWCITVFSANANANAPASSASAPSSASDAKKPPARSGGGGGGGGGGLERESGTGMVCQLILLAVEELHGSMEKWVHHYTSNKVFCALPPIHHHLLQVCEICMT